MISSKGDKLHVIIRRRFDGDLRRHFAGAVIDCEGATVRLQGYAFIYDEKSNNYNRKPDVRTTIIDLAESGYTVNLIPASVDLEKIHYSKAFNKNLVVTDGQQFSLDVNEFTATY